MSLKKVIREINKHNVFLITTHVNPDPDAICSQVALHLVLEKLGKKVISVNEERVPQRFDFFPGVKQVKSYGQIKKLEYDVAIIVDSGELSRIGKVKQLLADDKKIINIDHHVTNNSFGDVNYVDVKASSAAEAVFILIKEAKWPLTDKIALLLYAGIMTDTGSFRYENATARTHQVVSELKKFKFSSARIYRKIYESLLYKDMKNYSDVIQQFRRLQGGKVLSLELSEKTLKRFSDNFDLRDKIFSFLRSVVGMEVVLIFTENGVKKTRVNLRSSGRVDVARLAQIFGGGGHHNASGCLINGSIQRAKALMYKEIRKVI